MKFRPCIDLRDGKVVQIVGGTLKDSDQDQTITNFQSENDSTYFAKLYQQDDLPGGHVIALGPGNREAALQALQAYPGGMQYGGGVNLENAFEYLDAGASHIIVTSFVFRNGSMDTERLQALVDLVGKEKLVLDLSCRKKDDDYWVVTDRWSQFTDLALNSETLGRLAEFCDEYLVHGVDVEGKMSGMENELIERLGAFSPIPATYAGGARSLSDLGDVEAMGKGRVDLTIGSALDIFGGSVRYMDVVDWHRARN